MCNVMIVCNDAPVYVWKECRYLGIDPLSVSVHVPQMSGIPPMYSWEYGGVQDDCVLDPFHVFLIAFSVTDCMVEPVPGHFHPHGGPRCLEVFWL